MKVILISSVVPDDAGGGKLLLYRHFKDMGDIEFLVVSDGVVPDFNHVVLKHRPLSRVFKRMEKTCLRHWGFDAQEFFLPCNPKQVSEICKNFKPDVIITVAHGNLWRFALKEARSSGIPLMTIFHDWWPDLSGTHEAIKPFFDKQFRALHRNSTVSLPVCEGMLAVLGSHSRAEVLYPIPNASMSSISHANGQTDVAGRLKIIYMGNLGEYGGMVKAALEAINTSPQIRMEVRGRNQDWPTLFNKEMEERGLLHDFVPEEQLGDWLDTADAFLVTMRFEPHFRRFMETSFPSKLTHYAQFHKPIVIWGPEYCSAVRWARIKNSALCVTDPSPTALVRALETLSGQEWQRWAAKAREAANEDFNPRKIQRQFLQAINRAVETSVVQQPHKTPAA
jgi:glycosyltransferase involved in cell wall biosynthesis